MVCPVVLFMWLICFYIQEGIRIDWMSNVERLHIQDETVDLLLNKFQRHRGDTLNSRELQF